MSTLSRPNAARRALDVRARGKAPDPLVHSDWTLPVLGALVGAAAWSGHTATLPLALAFPALWIATTRRTHGGLVALAYYLAASRGLPAGAATFFGQGLYTGLLLWALAGLTLALPYGLLWSPERTRRLHRLPVILLIVALPPLGIVGWAHPVTAAGILFPGAGWLGLGLTSVLIVALARCPRAARRVIPLLVLKALAVPVAAAAPPGWQGIHTRFAADTGTRDFLRDYFRQQDLIRRVRESRAQVVVFPESAAGRWNDDTRALWEPLRRTLGSRAVLLGAERLLPGGRYENVIVRLGRPGDTVVYRQRQPVPLSMWRPWDSEGARAAWDAAPVFELAGQRVAPLICYEQFLIWPVLQSMWQRPGVLLAIGNGGWAERTSIPALERVAVTAWAALFGTALVSAMNL